MTTIEIKSQADWDNLPKAFKEFTVVEIKSDPGDVIQVNACPENSSVVAWGSSRVVAWGSSSVVARESSRVEAWGCASVHVKSDCSSITAASFAVIILLAKVKVSKKSKTVTVVEVQKPKTTKDWADWDGAKNEDGKLTLFKRVSKDFKTQENTSNETTWTIGTTLEHPDWNPSARECGPGKFHACSFASACDEFRSAVDDRYIALSVAIEDTYFWKDGDYPHKIAFRKGTVLYECDRFGDKIEAEKA